jgi:hypothetical protein
MQAFGVRGTPVPLRPLSPSLVSDAIKDSAVEYVILFGLWMLLVSMTKPQEIVAGLIAAFIADFADATIKSEDFAKFKPRPEWLPLIFWEAWYALDGTRAIMVALAKRLAGKESEAQFAVHPAPVEHVFPMSSMMRAIAASVLALALAGFSLSPYWPVKKSIYHPVKAAMMGLRRLHSGHVGDYVALLTLGVAAFGVTLSVLIKLGF